jgi:hypothetical protein
MKTTVMALPQVDNTSIPSPAVNINQIDEEDYLDPLLTWLGKQSGPVIFIVPAWGRAFAQGGDFARLRQATGSPGKISFVIPPARWEALAGAAGKEGFLVAPSVEAALNQLVAGQAAQRTTDFYPLLAGGTHDPTTGPVVPPPTSVYRRWPRVHQLAMSALLLILLLGAVGGLLAALQTPTAPFTVGEFAFLSSGQLNPISSLGLNDIVSLELHGMAAPAPGTALYAWLEADPGDDNVRPILLGKITNNGAGGAVLTYTDPQHNDLLVTYSQVLVTQQDASAVPVTPSLDPATHLYQGAIPKIPTPGDEKRYSLLSHLRHLLAADPTVKSIGLAGGLNVWLYRNSQMVLEEATTARDYWKSGSEAYMHRQITRILDYLDGYNYVWRDVPAGTPFLIDRSAGQIGLLTVDRSQTPPGYVAHVSLHLNGLVNSPGATAGQQALARRLDDALAKQVTSSYAKVRADAMQLVRMKGTQLRGSRALGLLNDMANYAQNAFAPGPFGQQTTGQGIVWILTQMASLATVSVEEGNV